MPNLRISGYFPMGLYGGDPESRTPTSGYTWPALDPTTIGTGTAASNVAALPTNVTVAEAVNAANRAAQQAALGARLGPAGERIEAIDLANIERRAAGLVDPQTEAMLRGGITAEYGARGFGVDTPALSAAYRRALGQTIEEEQAKAHEQYLEQLAAHPAAEVFSMENLLVRPETYAQSAAQAAELAQRQREFEAEMAWKQFEAARSLSQSLGGKRLGSRSPWGKDIPLSRGMTEYAEQAFLI